MKVPNVTTVFEAKILKWVWKAYIKHFPPPLDLLPMDILYLKDVQHLEGFITFRLIVVSSWKMHVALN